MGIKKRGLCGGGLICVSISPPLSTADALFYPSTRSKITASICGK